MPIALRLGKVDLVKEPVVVSRQVVYDTIAERYRDSKQLPFRDLIEGYTLFQALGDLHGRTVLDLACGEGFYTRRLKRAGAAEVTGVDVSRAMIALAEAEERARPIGCRYVCADAATFAPAAPVDIVIAVYLLNYARNQKELESLCRACFGALHPGGRLVGFNDNVRRPPRPGGSLAKYGIERTGAWPPREGDAIRYRITNPDGRTVEFDNYYLEPGIYERAMRSAGFGDFQWIDAVVDPVEEANPFWRDFLAQAPLVAFSATRPAQRPAPRVDS